MKQKLLVECSTQIKALGKHLNVYIMHSLYRLINSYTYDFI